jgi:hypothetical protein
MKILSYLFPVLLLTSCGGVSTGTYHNAAIDKGTQAQVTALHDQVVKALQQNKTHVVEGMLSEELKGDHDAIHAFVERTSELLVNSKSQITDAYHVVNRGGNESVSILSDDSAALGAFQIRYQAQTPETYVILSTPNIQGDAYRMFMVFGKYEEQWKLDILNMGRFTVAGKTAVDYYQIAQQQEEKGHLTNAINAMVIASSIASPAAPYWQYRIDDEMTAYNESLMQKALDVYPMPMTITTIPTSPELFKLMPQRVEDNICTMVKYRSSINISDTVALAAENALLHDLMPGTFKGIDKEVPYIFYRVYNEAPQEGVTVPYYGFVRETKGVSLTP